MKIRLTVSVDFEAHPESYRKGSTPEQMIKWEEDAMSEDPSLLMWLAEQPGSNMTVKGEVIP